MSDCRHNAPDHGPDAGNVQTQRQQLDERDRDRLLDQLIDCLYSIEGDTDTSAMDRCMEELEAAGVLCEDEFDVEQGLKDFHERFSMTFENNPPPEKVQKVTRVHRPFARIAIIAAVICACFMVTAQASGFDIIGAIAKWTSEQFSFVKVGSEKDDRQKNLSNSLLDTLKNNRITEQLAPTWFPEGTKLSDIQVRREKDNTLIFATYILNEETFFISFQNVFDAPHMEIEINDPDVDGYTVRGIEHHLMGDVRQRKVMWRNGRWECYIAGNINQEDLIAMIDSIYEE